MRSAGRGEVRPRSRSSCEIINTSLISLTRPRVWWPFEAALWTRTRATEGAQHRADPALMAHTLSPLTVKTLKVMNIYSACIPFFFFQLVSQCEPHAGAAKRFFGLFGLLGKR